MEDTSRKYTRQDQSTNEEEKVYYLAHSVALIIHLLSLVNSTSIIKQNSLMLLNINWNAKEIQLAQLLLTEALCENNGDLIDKVFLIHFYSKAFEEY